MTPERAFQIIQAWLTFEKATVKQSQPPYYIEASHGRRLQTMGWRKDARKTIKFQISTWAPTIHVTVEIIPASLNRADVNNRLEEARANWDDLLSSLWTLFGPTASLGSLPTRQTDWYAVMRRGKRSMLIGLLALAVGLPLVFLTYYFWIALVSPILLVYGAMNYRSAKKRLSSQQNRGLQSSGP